MILQVTNSVKALKDNSWSKQRLLAPLFERFINHIIIYKSFFSMCAIYKSQLRNVANAQQ